MRLWGWHACPQHTCGIRRQPGRERCFSSSTVCVRDRAQVLILVAAAIPCRSILLAYCPEFLNGGVKNLTSRSTQLVCFGPFSI